MNLSPKFVHFETGYPCYVKAYVVWPVQYFLIKTPNKNYQINFISFNVKICFSKFAYNVEFDNTSLDLKMTKWATKTQQHKNCSVFVAKEVKFKVQKQPFPPNFGEAGSRLEICH